MILNLLLRKLTLSDNDIINLKKNRSKVIIDERKRKIKNKFGIKFILYCILSTILLLFFWYYIGMFGAIY